MQRRGGKTHRPGGASPAATGTDSGLCFESDHALEEMEDAADALRPRGFVVFAPPVPEQSGGLCFGIGCWVEEFEHAADALRPRGFVVLAAFYSLVVKVLVFAPAFVEEDIAELF